MTTTEYHPLFVPDPDDDPYPAVELSGINVARIVPGRSKPVPYIRRMQPDELSTREKLAQLFGSGDYIVWGMRLYQGPEGEPANSFAKGHKKQISIGAEHGPWKAMIPPESPPPQAPAQQPPQQNGHAPYYGHPQQSGGPPPIPGMPPPQVFDNPLYFFMFMNQQREDREARLAAEQRAREDRLAAEAREREDRAQARQEADRQRTQELIMQIATRPAADPVGGIGQVAATLAETFGRIHAPPPPPAPPAHTIQNTVEDLKTIVEASKLVKGNDEIELLKAGAAVLQGLGGLNIGGGGGGGLSGAPTA